MDLKKWLSALSAELGVADVEITDALIKTLLDVARDTAHGVERVAAPLSTFTLGGAVGRDERYGGVVEGRGMSLDAAAAATAALLDRQSPAGD